MKLSELGLAILEMFEDCKLTGYLDQHGIPTAGYGHTGIDVVKGKTYTQEQAEEWLRADVNTAEASVTNNVKLALKGHEFDALTLLVYNAGFGALEHREGEDWVDSTLLKLVNAGKITEAADQFLLWDHVNGQPNAGLLRRRKVERALFLDSVA